jgi:hypothetical protein
MTIQNPFDKAPKAVKPEQDKVAVKSPAVNERELTDAELAMIAGGVNGGFSSGSERKH